MTEKLAAEYVPINYGGPVRYPRSTSFYVNDPSGYEIEISIWDGGAVAF